MNHMHVALAPNLGKSTLFLYLYYKSDFLLSLKNGTKNKKQKTEHERNIIDNRPFYSCVYSCLAIELKWGWSWPYFDRNLTAFVM